MINFLIQKHNELFFWMHSFLEHYPQYKKFIYISAERVDNYVVLLGFLLFFYFIYQSVKHHSLKRFHFLSKESVKILIAIGSSWFLSYVLKQLFSAPRPFLRFPEQVHNLFPYGGFDSFPSGHATLFAALGAMMLLHHKRVGYVFIFFALLISLARVISGVHFPIDILFGWIIGSLISYFVYKKLSF